MIKPLILAFTSIFILLFSISGIYKTCSDNIVCLEKKELIVKNNFSDCCEESTECCDFSCKHHQTFMSLDSLLNYAAQSFDLNSLKATQRGNSHKSVYLRSHDRPPTFILTV